MTIQKDNISLAKDMMNENNFKDASTILQEMWENDAEDKRKNYIGFLLLQCYQKLSLWNPAISLAQELIELEDCWQSIKTNYAWIIYFAFFKNQNNLSLEELLIHIDTLYDLLKDDDSQLPLFLSVQNMILKNPHLSKDLAVQLLEKVSLDVLQNQNKNQNKKKSDLPGSDEQYIMLYSKCLLEAELYDKCVEFCKQALQTSQHISSANRIWLSRRLALSLHKTGDAQKAQSIYQIISAQKPEWYIFFEYAKIQHSLEDKKDALAKAAKAAVMRGELEMKIHLFSFLSSELFSQGYYSEATKCLALTAAIRSHNSWKIDQQLLSELSRYNLSIQKLPHPKEIFEELKDFLTKLSYADHPEVKGSVSRILPHGKAGFIKSANDSYYFKMSDLRFPKHMLKDGTKLCFHLEKSFDPKKGIESHIAVNIRLDQ